MKHFFIIQFFLILFNQSTSAQNINVAKLDSLFDAVSMNNKGMGSFAIAKDGVVVYEKSIGFSNIEKKQIANKETLYRIGSITKMFTAVIVFQLIEEGKLTLDSPVSTFFPNDKVYDKMTISTLLKHKSGLYDFVNEHDSGTWLTKPQKEQSILDTIKNGKSYFEPDTKFLYSNSGYFLLVKIIEKVEGKKYNKIINDRIFSKLGLKKTFCLSTAKTQKKEALSYKMNKEWEKINDFYFTNVTGVGDVLSTPSDLILISSALFNGKLLSEKSVNQMKTFEKGPFGMGVMRTPFYSHLGFGHAGDTYGTHSILTFFPDDQLTISFCLNAEVMPRNDLAIAILKICFNQEYKIPTFKKILVDPQVMQSYIGDYTCKQLPFKFKVFIEDEELYAQATGQEAILIEPKSLHKFEVEELQASFDFNPETKQLTFKQGNASFLFTKDESK